MRLLRIPVTFAPAGAAGGVKRKPPVPKTRLLAVDLGRTNCKVGVFQFADHQSQLVATERQPVANRFLAQRGLHPMIPTQGYREFLRFLGGLLTAHGAKELALALPFPVGYRDGVLGTVGEAEWPEQVSPVVQDCQRAGANRVLLLNDAVACALGHRGSVPPTEAKQPRLCLTLGTFFGCA